MELIAVKIIPKHHALKCSYPWPDPRSESGMTIAPQSKLDWIGPILLYNLFVVFDILTQMLGIGGANQDSGNQGIIQ